MNVYTFEKMDDESKLAGSSKLINVVEGFPPDYSEQCVLFQGRLLSLLGPPLYETANLENQYRYIIQAADKEGNLYYLDVYNGSSGPAIGGDPSIEGIQDVATAFVEETQAAPPADFSYEGYYLDTPSKISMGIRDGEVYYSEEAVTDPDEVARIIEEFY